MSDDSESLLTRLKRTLRRAFLTHVPDHPAHGGNTGEAEWPSDEEPTDATDDTDG